MCILEIGRGGGGSEPSKQRRLHIHLEAPSLKHTQPTYNYALHIIILTHHTTRKGKTKLKPIPCLDVLSSSCTQHIKQKTPPWEATQCNLSNGSPLKGDTFPLNQVHRFSRFTLNAQKVILVFCNTFSKPKDFYCKRTSQSRAPFPPPPPQDSKPIPAFFPILHVQSDRKISQGGRAPIDDNRSP